MGYVDYCCNEAWFNTLFFLPKIILGWNYYNYYNIIPVA
jgi:hypothetical protein